MSAFATTDIRLYHSNGLSQRYFPVEFRTFGHARRQQWASTSSSGAASRRYMTLLKAVWAFDFDGVICDSVGESSQSSWKAAARVWPDLFAEASVQEQRATVLEQMRAARPVIETGYENIVQVRCLLEGISVDDILSNWHTLLPEYMQKWELDRSQLVEVFGTTRDEWMADDLEGWLLANGIYSGLPEILKHVKENHELYIVTTKQARFTEALLRDLAKVPVAGDRIYSQAESGLPKSEVLEMLQERHPGTSYHFVEDKYGTLAKVLKLPGLDRWKVYLVDWGYNTEAERKEAAATGKIAVVSKAQLQKAVN